MGLFGTVPSIQQVLAWGLQNKHRAPSLGRIESAFITGFRSGALGAMWKPEATTHLHTGSYWCACAGTRQNPTLRFLFPNHPLVMDSSLTLVSFQGRHTDIPLGESGGAAAKPSQHNPTPGRQKGSERGRSKLINNSPPRGLHLLPSRASG